MEITKRISITGDIDSVPKSEFDISTAEWKGARAANNGMLGGIILPEYFDIPLVDLIELLAEIAEKPESYKVRAHLGISDYDGVYNGNPNTSEMRLYLTGVDEKGESIYSEDGESAIYDFVTPCPPTCQGGGGISG